MLRLINQYVVIFLRWLLPDPPAARPEPKPRPINSVSFVYPTQCTNHMQRWSVDQINRSIELDSTKPRETFAIPMPIDTMK